MNDSIKRYTPKVSYTAYAWYLQKMNIFWRSWFSSSISISMNWFIETLKILLIFVNKCRLKWIMPLEWPNFLYVLFWTWEVRTRVIPVQILSFWGSAVVYYTVFKILHAPYIFDAYCFHFNDNEWSFWNIRVHRMIVWRLTTSKILKIFLSLFFGLILVLWSQVQNIKKVINFLKGYMCTFAPPTWRP